MLIMIIIAITYLFAGFIDSICGGGGLLTIPVLIITGLPVHSISGTNQCSTILGGTTAAIQYWKNKKCYLPSALIACVTAILGAHLGARLNTFASEQLLRIIMIFCIPLIGFFTFRKNNFSSGSNIVLVSKSQMILSSAFIGLALGAYQAFYGPGGGLFYTLAFCYFQKLDFITASGNARFVGVISSLVAAITYASSGLVLWKIAIVATIFNIIGSYIGSRLAIKNGAKIIRPVLLFVIIVFFIKLIADTF